MTLHVVLCSSRASHDANTHFCGQYVVNYLLVDYNFRAIFA